MLVVLMQQSDKRLINCIDVMNNIIIGMLQLIFFLIVHYILHILTGTSNVGRASGDLVLGSKGSILLETELLIKTQQCQLNHDFTRLFCKIVRRTRPSLNQQSCLTSFLGKYSKKLDLEHRMSITLLYMLALQLLFQIGSLNC